MLHINYSQLSCDKDLKYAERLKHYTLTFQLIHLPQHNNGLGGDLLLYKERECIAAMVLSLLKPMYTVAGSPRRRQLEINCDVAAWYLFGAGRRCVINSI